MTKEQLIKIYSAYFPYRVNFRDSDGHIQYLLSQHYNIFNLPETEFIKK